MFLASEVLNHLHYGNFVWNALSNAKPSKLQRLQTRARKLIVDSNYKDGWNCKWVDVKPLISFDQGVMTYKILHGLCPHNLRHKFVERYMISEYGTRNRRDLQIPKIRLEYAKRSFYISGVKSGMIFLAASENKSHSLVSKRDLENTFLTCKAQTRPLGRAAILFYLASIFRLMSHNE